MRMSRKRWIALAVLLWIFGGEDQSMPAGWTVEKLENPLTDSPGAQGASGAWGHELLQASFEGVAGHLDAPLRDGQN
jgi:hypothetical protein